MQAAVFFKLHHQRNYIKVVERGWVLTFLTAEVGNLAVAFTNFPVIIT